MYGDGNRILILSNNLETAKSLSQVMEHLGFFPSITKAVDGERINLPGQDPPDAMLFDLSLWDEATLTRYLSIKENTSYTHQTPGTILITTTDIIHHVSQIQDFDDIIIVPYKREELAFRLKRLLFKNNKLADQNIIKAKELVLHLASYEAYLAGRIVELTFKEFELLKYLVSNQGRAFNRETLLRTIWGYDFYGGTRTVDVHIRRIRAKLEDCGENYIKTIHGVGYMFKA